MSEPNCPRCADGVVYATNVFDDYIHLPKSEQSLLGMRAVAQQRVMIRRLICVNCGYLETYVVDHEFLKQVPQSQAWIKV